MLLGSVSSLPNSISRQALAVLVVLLILVIALVLLILIVLLLLIVALVLVVLLVLIVALVLLVLIVIHDVHLLDLNARIVYLLCGMLIHGDSITHCIKQK